jgi:hypothetical protein
VSTSKKRSDAVGKEHTIANVKTMDIAKFVESRKACTTGKKVGGSESVPVPSSTKSEGKLGYKSMKKKNISISKFNAQS